MFFAEVDYFWGILVASDLWKTLGWSAIIYFAAIAGIDPSLYEAASVDGATRIRKIFSITLPCIAGTIALLFTLAVSGMLNTNFDQIFVLRNSLNEPKSMVIDLYVYVMGLRMNQPSFATAVGLFKSVISLALLIMAHQVTKRITR